MKARLQLLSILDKVSRVNQQLRQFEIDNPDVISRYFDKNDIQLLSKVIILLEHRIFSGKGYAADHSGRISKNGFTGVKTRPEIKVPELPRNDGGRLLSIQERTCPMEPIETDVQEWINHRLAASGII